MSEKTSSLPLPAGSYPQPTGRSKFLRLTAITLAISGLLLIAPSNTLSSVKDAARTVGGHCGMSNKWTAEDVKVFDEWVKCPKQPKAIYPKMKWEMTDDEKKKSVDLFSQAVVCSHILSRENPHSLCIGLW